MAGTSFLDGRVTLHLGDCLEVLRAMPDQSVNCVVTSPPYFGLRDYGHDGQIGLEATPAEFVAKMVEVFAEVRRVLRDDGTCWLNLGDTYNNNPSTSAIPRAAQGNGTGAFQIPSEKHVQANRAKANKAQPLIEAGIKKKELIGIPWRVAFALQDDGWYLRQDIIWHKPNPMPESVRDRCTKAHEYVFLLTKSPRYFYDADAISEVAVCGANGSEFAVGKTGEHQLGRAQKIRPSVPRGGFDGKTEVLGGRNAFRAVRETRNRRSVWSISTQPFSGAHFATMAPELAETCILAGSPRGGIVLDPFGGAGTTALVALRHGRRAELIELNPEYAGIAQRRIEREWRVPERLVAPDFGPLFVGAI